LYEAIATFEFEINEYPFAIEQREYHIFILKLKSNRSKKAGGDRSLP